ncbi:MAG: signal recognition particle [Clostridia bacterium]|nr:signal recognition particle [Clostridia bacterium]
MKLEQTVEFGLLLDTYGDMLTSKKQEMLSMYVNDNMSYQEIADSLNISKPAVLDSIKTAQNKLIKLEQKIGMLALKQKLAGIAQGNNVKQDLISLLKEI